MPKLLSVSSADLSSLAALIDKLPPDRATALDPSDPVHLAGIKVALAAANRSPERYPALHAGATNGAGSGAGDTLTLIDRGRDKSGRATAMTWYAAGPNAIYAGGSLFALDGESGELLAAGHNSNVGEGFVPVSTDTESAKPAGKSLKLLSVNHSVSKTGDVSFTALASTATVDTSGDPTFPLTVQQPIPKNSSSTNLLIAVGRTGQVPANADYIYTEPQDLPTPYLIVPFIGEAVLPYAIVGTPGQPIPNTTLTTMLYFVTGTTTLVIPVNLTYTKSFSNAVTLNIADPNKMTMDWKYPFDGSSYTNTTSLVYNQQSLVNERMSYFYYGFQIPIVNGPTPTFPFAICSKNTPNQPSPNCFAILLPIMFWWHCLAAGTKVNLADGSEAPIETLDNTHRVLTGAEGAHYGVEATSRGMHKASKNDTGPAAVYRLTTEGGHELIGTGQHVIKTPGGLRPLYDLSPGDEVATADGTTRVAGCEAVDWDGPFYNLQLGNESDRAEGLKEGAVCTYIANGLIVGDHLAMNAEHRRLARDVEHMRAHLPEHLVADYASAIEDIQY